MAENNTVEISIEEKALKRATDKIDFYSHFIIYITVNFFLLLLNLAVDSNNLWVKYVILGWGIGVAVHAVSVFIIDGMLDGFKDKIFQSELNKLKSKQEQK